MAETDRPGPEAIVPQSLEQKLKETVPDETKRAELLSLNRVKSITHQEIHRGPLPSPRTLREYDKIKKGLAERIVIMAENQSNHRINLENKAISSQLDESRKGQDYGLTIGLAGLVTCLILALTSHDWVAGIIGSSTLVGLVTVFVVGRRKQKEDLASKG